MENTFDRARKLDLADELSDFKDKFHIPKNKEGKDKIYLCGNSLGLQPKSTKSIIEQELDDWADLGVDGHVNAKNPWLSYHEALSEPMAKIVGAKASEVVIMNSLTVNLHLMMVSFYNPVKGRSKILIEYSTFPSDVYAVKSQIRFHGFNPETDLLFLKPKDNSSLLTREDIDEMLALHGNEIALIMIGGVNYYTGQYFDLKYITDTGHKHGCIVGFDLAHGAGNIQPNLHETGADFAVWCTYKYLNSGPGALSGAFIHEKHQDWGERPRFEGWWGTNKTNRFKMKHEFESMLGAEAWQLSNPPILAMAPIKASLAVFEEAGMHRLREKSKLMVEFALDCLEDLPQDQIKILIPQDPEARGCQLSLQMQHPDKSFFHALEARDIVADWREPDVIRIAPVPLYNTFMDIYEFSNIIKEELSKI